MNGFILRLIFKGTVSVYLFPHFIENSFFLFIINLPAIAYTGWFLNSSVFIQLRRHFLMSFSSALDALITSNNLA